MSPNEEPTTGEPPGSPDETSLDRWRSLVADAAQFGADGLLPIARAIRAVHNLPDDASGDDVDRARAKDPSSDEEMAAEYLAAYRELADT